MKDSKNNGPRILLLDIETAPLVVYTWDIWQQVITPEQIIEDWSVLSWSAKWLGNDKMLYMDNRKEKNPRNDKKIIEAMHKLMDEADIIVTHNGKSFDEKRLNARFIIHGLKPTSPKKHFDTKQVAKRKFKFTSNSLKELCKYLNLKTKKDEHKKFPGRELWNQVLKKNQEAWKEMEKYNKIDVLALEELYKKLEPWDNKINHAIYTDLKDVTCNCGSKHFHSRGTAKTKTVIYKKYQCQDCGTWTTGKRIPLTKEQRDNLRKKI